MGGGFTNEKTQVLIYLCLASFRLDACKIFESMTRTRNFQLRPFGKENV